MRKITFLVKTVFFPFNLHFQFIDASQSLVISRYSITMCSELKEIYTCLLMVFGGYWELFLKSSGDVIELARDLDILMRAVCVGG